MFSTIIHQSVKLFTSAPIATPCTLFAIFLLSKWLFSIIYNYFFHPLRKYPGPLLCKISRIPSVYHEVRGDSHLWHYAQHRQYGSIVRFKPNSLAFTDECAWKDIHGFKKAPIKDPKAYSGPPNGISSLFSEQSDETHARQRKIFTHAFSDRALKEQEPHFVGYIDTLVDRIKRTVKTDPNVQIDMVKLLNFTTFDIMADLAFGESLGLLQSSDYSPWVGMLLGAFKAGAYVRAVMAFEPFTTLFKFWKPSAIEKARRDHFDFSAERVNKRLAASVDRPDIWGLVLRNQEKGAGLSLGEMHSNAGLFMGAGTETTATELAGLLYYLLKTPTAMATLVNEIRSEFPHSDTDITMERLTKLTYLHACIEEGLRIYPPVPAGLPRVIKDPAGTLICGNLIPAGTRVTIPQFSTYRLNFSHPDSFHPERFLPSPPPEFTTDRRSALQPFSYGPRNCLGKNMAYHEMRLVLVKLLWNFEFELGEGMVGWAERQGSFGIWEKGPLVLGVRLRM